MASQVTASGASSLSDSLNACLASGDLQPFARQLNALESDIATRPDDPALTLTYYAPYIATLLATDQLQAAGFLWLRIPYSMRKEKELAALYKILLATREKSYQQVYSLLDAVEWSPSTRQILRIFSERHRAAMLDLLSRSFSSITPDHAATYLGVKGEDLITLVTQNGWKQDSNMLLPTTHPCPPTSTGGTENFMTLSHVVAKLEN